MSLQKMIQKVRLAMFETEKSRATHKSRVKLEREQTRAKLELIFDEVCASVPLKKRDQCLEMNRAQYSLYTKRVLAYRQQVFLHSVNQVLERLARLEENEGNTAFERMGF